MPAMSVFAALPEGIRVKILAVLSPVVFPVHRFVCRWYHTPESLRLSKMRGEILYHQLNPGKQTDAEVLERVWVLGEKG
jgi:hypothetical protein